MTTPTPQDHRDRAVLLLQLAEREGLTSLQRADYIARAHVLALLALSSPLPSSPAVEALEPRSLGDECSRCKHRASWHIGGDLPGGRGTCDVPGCGCASPRYDA